MNKKILGVVAVVAILLAGAAGIYIWKTAWKISGSYTVVSEDNNMVLTVSRSAMPSGISAGDISIAKVEAPDFSPLEKLFEPIAVYRFSPEEVVFDEPVQFSITVPDNGSGSFPDALHVEHDGVEAIEELNVERDENGNFRLVGKIQHFSAIVVHLGPISIIMERDLGEYTVGESFTVPVNLVTAKLYDLYHNTQVEVEYAAVVGGGEFTHGTASIAQPEVISNTPPGGTQYNTLPNSALVEGKFICVKPGRVRVFYEINLLVKQSFTDKGIWEQREGLEILIGGPLEEDDPVYDSFYTTFNRWFLDYSDARCVKEDTNSETPSQPQAKDIVPQSALLPKDDASVPSIKDLVRPETPSEICPKFIDNWFPAVETYEDGCGNPGSQHVKVIAQDVSFNAVFSFLTQVIDDWDTFAKTDYSTSLGLDLGTSGTDEYGTFREFVPLQLGHFGVRSRNVVTLKDEQGNDYQIVNMTYRVRFNQCATDILVSGTSSASDMSYADKVFAALQAKIQENVSKMKALYVCNP